jgi:hypothetical protein
MANGSNDPPKSAGYSGTGGTVTVNGKDFAVGLVWERAGEGKPATAARAAAVANCADLFCVRKPGKNQFGLASRSAGHKAGMPSLAAYLGETVEGTFVGAFDIGAGFYVIAIREDMVLAGNDRIVADKDEAIEVFQELALAMAWDQSVCPKEWSIEGTKQETLEGLLTRDRPRTRLEPVSQFSKYLQIGVCASLVIAGLLAWQTYGRMQEEAESAAEAEQAAAAASADREAKDRANQFVLPVLPWEGNPYGVNMIPACVDAINQAPLDVPGWQPTTVICTLRPAQIDPAARRTVSPPALAISVAFDRKGGTINWIGAALNRGSFRPSVTQSASGSAIAGWIVPAPEPFYPMETRDGQGSVARPNNIGQARIHIISQFDEVYHQVDLKEEIGVTAKIPNGRGQVEDAVLERHLVFSFGTRQDPKEFAAILAPIPALLTTSVRLDLASWKWSIEGTIHERLPLQLPGQRAGAR